MCEFPFNVLLVGDCHGHGLLSHFGPVLSLTAVSSPGRLWFSNVAIPPSYTWPETQAPEVHLVPSKNLLNNRGSACDCDDRSPWFLDEHDYKLAQWIYIHKDVPRSGFAHVGAEPDLIGGWWIQRRNGTNSIESCCSSITRSRTSFFQWCCSSIN